MNAIRPLLIVSFTFLAIPLGAQESSWVKTLKGREKRGTLQDAFQVVRGDSGKWNDDPSLQHAPPIDRKPPKISLDDWDDLMQRTRRKELTSKDDNWLLFKTRQLNDNDRVWIERIERRGNQFTVVFSQAVWQGRYSKNFTQYNVYGVNLGKLEPGEYQAKWIIKPLVFSKFEGTGQPRDNWPSDEKPTDNEPTELSVAFTVTAAP